MARRIDAPYHLFNFRQQMHDELIAHYRPRERIVLVRSSGGKRVAYTLEDVEDWYGEFVDEVAIA